LRRKTCIIHGLLLCVSLVLITSCTMHTPPTTLMGISKTGQTLSYAEGDDGNLQEGSAWPVPRFTDHGDGTVTDTLTGLMWTKSAAHTTEGTTWSEAIAFCNNLDFAGFSDWHLPNIGELHSLIDFSKSKPAVPPDHPFEGIQELHYWSSTTYEGDTNSAWVIFFPNGATGYAEKKEGFFNIWPVRNNK